MNNDVLVRQIQNELGNADVRTDQCETVRVYWRRRASFVKELPDLSIEVAVELRPAPSTADFLQYPRIVEIALDEQDAARKLVHWLKRVDVTDFDAPDEWQT